MIYQRCFSKYCRAMALTVVAAGLFGLALSPVASAQRIIIPAEGEGGPQVIPTSTGTQVVFLDFDSSTGTDEHVYTPAERAAIQVAMEKDYGLFDFSFAQSAPTSGPFTTMFFNQGSPGGLAVTGIDFRNLDRNGIGQLNLNSLIGGTGLPPDTSDTWVNFSAFVASHELGHLVGLRHGDSFGPVGTGLPSTGSPGAFDAHACALCGDSTQHRGYSDYTPNYPGPQDANFSTRHLMASPASVGQSLSEATGLVSYFGVREAIKLTINETPSVVTIETGSAHGDSSTAQALTLATLAIGNTLEDSNEPNFGKALSADAEVVVGTIATSGESDFYSFLGEAGDVLNVEVISVVLNRITNSVDTTVTVYGADGTTPVNYYGIDAFNDNEIEGSSDSILIDLVLETTGQFFIEVASANPLDTGSYELLVYRFNQALVPEPGTMALLFCGTLLIATRRGKRREAA